MGSKGRGLDVEVVSPSTFRAPGLADWLRRVAPRAAQGDVTVAFVSDRHISRLNGRFRGNERPTDVLSFPSEAPPHLGDVIIARGVAKRQAARAGHSMATELRVLALHGLLHLLGYDHERDSGRMARIERRLRRQGGLPAGLIERGPAHR